MPRFLQPPGAPAWPALTDITTELVFNRAEFQVNALAASVADTPGVRLVSSNARIPNLMNNAVVDVQLRLKGPVSSVLGFVSSTPLATMTGNVLTGMVASGNADYALRLSLPINNIDKTRVEGTVSLPNNEAQFSPATPPLSRLRGLVTFTESGFNVASAQAQLLGGDIRFEGGTRLPARSANLTGETEASPVFRAQGTVLADSLRQAKDLGFASRLAQNATGSAAYTASLGFRRGVAEVVVASNLQGMALNLPMPFNKSADAVLPVRFERTLLKGTAQPGQKLQDQLTLAVGSAGAVATVQYQRDISGNEAKMTRGSIAVGLEPGESSAMPESGVAANIKLANVNVDAWERLFSNAVGSPGAAAPTQQAGPTQVAQSYLPNQLAIRAKELTVSGRTLNNLVIGGSRQGSIWRANLDASELNGYVEYRQPGNSGAGLVYARLSRLNLAASTASDVESLLGQQPLNIPALDVVVEDLELRGKKLGRVEIDALNLSSGSSSGTLEGGVREWRLRSFNVILPEATFTARGNWADVSAQARTPRNAPERRRTAMTFQLDIRDSGELLSRLGMKDVVRRGKGKMIGQVGWLGSPLALDYPSMSGQFNVNIESGQFLKADPGLAKLLGVLSLQSLPRRLALDFRDVFTEGFAFDFVRGDVNIAQGIASTNNLQMKGVNAAVLMEGSADIAKETQNLRVIVVPEINAGTVSLITAVINPMLGLGTFLAQLVLRQPLIRAATQEFLIDGSWVDPKITKVTTKPPDSKASEKID